MFSRLAEQRGLLPLEESIIIHTRYTVGLEKTYLLEVLSIEIKTLTIVNIAEPINLKHNARGGLNEKG